MNIHRRGEIRAKMRVECETVPNYWIKGYLD